MSCDDRTSDDVLRSIETLLESIDLRLRELIEAQKPAHYEGFSVGVGEDFASWVSRQLSHPESQK